MNDNELMENYKENKQYQQQMFTLINKLSEQTSGVFVKRNISNMII